MKNLKYLIIILAINLLGCFAFQPTYIEKHLFSHKYPKNKINELKNIISEEGFYVYDENRVSCVEYRTFTDCVTTSRFLKGIIQITLSFKETNPPSIFYRNLGIVISGPESKDSPQITTEVERIDNLLYKKLLNNAGPINVRKGKNVR